MTGSVGGGGGGGGIRKTVESIFITPTFQMLEGPAGKLSIATGHAMQILQCFSMLSFATEKGKVVSKEGIRNDS